MSSTNNQSGSVPHALAIAGFDPSGGAGILADARTFTAFGFQASAAITSITFQNEADVFGASHQTAEAVRNQVSPLLKNRTFVCAKTGMLPRREVVSEVARLFRETKLPAPVVDPVIISSSGERLMEESALDVLIVELLPLARLLTPNISEAQTLAAMEITSEAAMRVAAEKIRKLGARAVLIKGGHLRGPANGPTATLDEEAIDLLDDDGSVTVFRERRLVGVELHGSGCILSAAIAAGLGKGMNLEGAVGAAKTFVLAKLKNAQLANRKNS